MRVCLKRKQDVEQYRSTNSQMICVVLISGKSVIQEILSEIEGASQLLSWITTTLHISKSHRQIGLLSSGVNLLSVCYRYAV